MSISVSHACQTQFVCERGVSMGILADRIKSRSPSHDKACQPTHAHAHAHVHGVYTCAYVGTTNGHTTMRETRVIT